MLLHILYEHDEMELKGGEGFLPPDHKNPLDKISPQVCARNY